MAGSLNRVQLIGNVGKDPEIRTLNNGNRVASFSLGMSERWKDRSGDTKEKTEWANVVCFNDGLVGVIEKYVEKGSKIFVEGQMQTRKYEKDGIDRYTTEVVIQNFGGQIILLGSKPEGGGSTSRDDFRGSGARSVAGRDSDRTRAYSPRESFVADLDDEIPF